MPTNTQEVETIKLSQAAAELLESSCLVMTTMFEDWTLDAYEATRCEAEWIVSNSNGAFVLVEAGPDLIIPPCRHSTCETYKPLSSLVLVPTAVWDEQKEAILAADAEWRKQALQCRVEVIDIPRVDF